MASLPNTNEFAFVPSGTYTGTGDKWFKARITTTIDGNGAAVNPNKYRIYSSTDGVSFTQIGSGSTNIVANQVFDFTDGVKGKFTRTGGTLNTNYELGDQWVFKCDTRLYGQNMVDINLVNDQGQYHIIYARPNGIGIIEDAYSGNPEVREPVEIPQTDRQNITMNTKNRDTYIGIGPEQTPMYVGIPNHSQFGEIKKDFVIESAALDLHEQFIGYFEKSLYENDGTDDIVWGFEKNSPYLKKVTLSGTPTVVKYDMKKVIRSICHSSDNSDIYVLTEGQMWGKVLKVDKSDGSIDASCLIKPAQGGYPSPGSYLSDIHHMQSKVWLAMHSPTKVVANQKLVYHLTPPTALDQEKTLTNVTPQMSIKKTGNDLDETTPSAGTWVHKEITEVYTRTTTSGPSGSSSSKPEEVVTLDSTATAYKPGFASGNTVRFSFAYYNKDLGNTNDHASLLWIFNYQGTFVTDTSDDDGTDGSYNRVLTHKRLFWDGTDYHSLGTCAHILGRYIEAQDADPTARTFNDKCHKLMLSPGGKDSSYTMDKDAHKKIWDVTSLATMKAASGNTLPATDLIITTASGIMKKYEITAAMLFGTATDTTVTFLPEEAEEEPGNGCRIAYGYHKDNTYYNMYLSFQSGEKVLQHGRWLIANDGWIPTDASVGSLLTMTITSAGSGDDVFGETDGAHNYYKVSFVYDGYQESPMIETGRTPSTQNKKKKTIVVTVDPTRLPERVSHIRVYSANNSKQDGGSAPSPDLPDTNYRLVKDLPLDDKIWSYSNSLYRATITDTGKKGVSYNALVGISETIDTMTMRYGISTTHNGYLVAGKCGHAKLWDIGNFLFKSKPGNFSQFDYSKDYLALPGQPTALASFNGHLYAFDKARTWVVDMDRLYVRDEFLGAGCWYQRGVISTDLGLFHFDKNNIYHNTGNGAKPIGNQILKSDTDELKNLAWHSLDLDSCNPIMAFDSNRKSLVIFFENPDGTDGRAWVYNTMLQRWDLWTSEEVTSSTQGKDGEVIATNGRNIFQYAYGSTRKDWEWQTKRISVGNDTIKKFFKRVRAIGSGSPEVKYRTSGANYSALTGSPTEDVDSSDRKHYDIQVQLKSRSGQGGTDEVDALGIIFRPLSPR